MSPAFTAKLWCVTVGRAKVVNCAAAPLEEPLMTSCIREHAAAPDYAARHLAPLAQLRAGTVDPTQLSVPALLYWGQQLADADYPTGAADIFRYILHVEPTQLAAWHALGLCHLELDDFETAARLFELASEMGQRQAFLQLAAQAWFAAGDTERGTLALLAVWETTQ